jgi:microcystin-dependent protein
MRGRIPLHQGTGPGLSARQLGSKSGAERVTLTTNQLASHSHDWNANTAAATDTAPQGKVLAEGVPVRLFKQEAQDVDMASSTIANTGGSQPHTNLMPTLCVHFIIALVGIYPSRH